jgi:hypothetical protein
VQPKNENLVVEKRVGLIVAYIKNHVIGNYGCIPKIQGTDNREGIRNSVKWKMFKVWS